MRSSSDRPSHVPRWRRCGPSRRAARRRGTAGREGPPIGLLWPYSLAIATPFGDAFRQGLGRLGYVDGRNIALEERWADGKFDRLASLAAELVRLKVDVLVTASTPATQAAQQATKTTPIVMTLVSDPVDSGFVANLAHPGGNITGLSYMHPELSRKRLELIKDVIPKVSRVAVLSNPSNPSIRPCCARPRSQRAP